MDRTTARSRPDRRVLTVPNVISFARLAAVPAFLWLWISERHEEAVVVYGVGAFTDFLDGYIARRTGAVTELGKLIDPLADRVFIAALAAALVVGGALPLWLAAVVVLRDVAILAAWPVLERRGAARIPVNAVGKVATASLLVGLTSLAVSETSFEVASVGDEVGLTLVGAGAVLYWVATILYARTALRRLGTHGG